MVFKDVSHGLERGDADHWPDIALYPTHARAEDAYRLSKDYSSLKSLAECRGPHLARCAYPWMITAIEVKTESIESGFGFTPDEPLLLKLEGSEDARSKFATYAAEIMLRQHRTHLYMFYIAGSYARMFRWDRNGAIVSYPIDLTEYSELKVLLNLMYRLIVATPENQGYDTTATLATKDDVAKLLSYETENVYLQQYHRLMVDNMGQYPIFKVRVLFASSWYPSQ